MKADDGSGRPKIAAAKEALNTLVDELPDDAKVGLRVYGSQVSGTGKAAGCADTKLVSPVAPLDRTGLKASINAITPRGFTPIGRRCRRRRRTWGARSRRRSCRLRRRRQLRAARRRAASRASWRRAAWR